MSIFLAVMAIDYEHVIIAFHLITASLIISLDLPYLIQSILQIHH